MKLLPKLAMAAMAALSINGCKLPEGSLSFPGDSEVGVCSLEVRQEIAKATKAIKYNQQFINWDHVERACNLGLYKCGKYGDIGRLRGFYQKIVTVIMERPIGDYQCFRGGPDDKYPGGYAYGGRHVVFDERCMHNQSAIQELIVHEVAHNVEQAGPSDEGVDSEKHRSGNRNDYIYLVGDIAKEAEETAMKSRPVVPESDKPQFTINESGQLILPKNMKLEWVPNCSAL